MHSGGGKSPIRGVENHPQKNNTILVKIRDSQHHGLDFSRRRCASRLDDRHNKRINKRREEPPNSLGAFCEVFGKILVVVVVVVVVVVMDVR